MGRDAIKIHTLTTMSKNTPERRFAVAVSFPGEHRRFVLNVVSRLAEQLGRDRVFYDEWYEAELVGLDGDLKLRRYYREQSEVVVPFFSEHYAKDWCQIEWSAIRAMLKERRKEDAVIPVEMDGTRVDGWEAIDFAIRRGRRSARAIADLILAAYRQRHPEQPSGGTPVPNPAGSTDVLAFGRPGGAMPSGGMSVRADISRILKYAPEGLVGREKELKRLDDAWDRVVGQDGEKTPGHKNRPHVLTFVALGGEGKTALVAKWVAELAGRDWVGCEAAFAWSFYSQGTREQQAASSDLFLKEALAFFGDEADKEFGGSAAGAFERGQRLARVVGQRRSLLILDGVEPLQYAPTTPTAGELKDQGLVALLKGLATHSRGLCVVTTRYALPDLRAFRQTTATEVKLERLSRAGGVDLLEKLGVKGSKLRNVPSSDGEEKLNEFEKLVEDVKGHALTLTLLGSYLRDAHDGDIRRRDRVKLEEADAEEQGGHAFRVMEAYEHAFEREGEKGQRALAILRLLGFFDRPMSADCCDALLKAPAIVRLTEPLVGLSEAQLNVVLSRLEAAKLITRHGGDSVIRRSSAIVRHSVDAHPLLREYFGQQVREKTPEAWRVGHKRLYEHLCKHKEGDQPTLEDLQPLYQAVAHGCQAGLHKEALYEVYYARIVVSNEYYSMNRLGAFGSDLGAIANFFELPWGKLVSGLSADARARVPNIAAFALRGLGRLAEAAEPIRLGLMTDAKREDWTNAAIASMNLSEIELTLGRVGEAVKDAEQGVNYADRGGDAFQRMLDRTSLAEALRQAGRREAARMLFEQAEEMQKERQPEYPLLYSLPGFQYGDLLLGEAERAGGQAALDISHQPSALSKVDACRAVARRAAQTLKWAEENSLTLLTIALDHLTLGRAALYETILTKSEFGAASSELDQAVDGLRRAGTQHYLPCGLLTRAWLRFLIGARTGAESAQADLDEAWEIAARGPMRLHMADYHLYRARLFWRHEPYPWNQDEEGRARTAADDLKAARELIEKCGYWRRKEELEDAEGVILRGQGTGNRDRGPAE